MTYRIRADNGNLPPAPFSTAPAAVRTTSTDTDGDGLPDVDEISLGTNPTDPDSDDDGIIDSLDRDPNLGSNALASCVSPDATLNLPIPNGMTCAASNSVTTVVPAGATATGDLLVIAPRVTFGPGFHVELNGRLTVISTDPSAITLPP